MIEDKPIFMKRCSQGILDLVVYHFKQLNIQEVNPKKQVLVMVAHHNHIFEFMRIFNRTEFVPKKPVYCWAAAIEIGINMTADLKE